MTEYDSNSTYRAKHGHVDLSKLQQSLSIKNRIVQPQQALQLNQTLILAHFPLSSETGY